jgi:type I restriction enzyme M protein
VLDALNAFIEENAIEDGPLWEALNEKGTITRGSATTRMHEAQAAEDEEVAGACTEVLQLLHSETVSRREAREQRANLDNQVLQQYDQLSEADVKELVVSDKWYGSIRTRIDSELRIQTRRLIARVQQLGVRYAEPLEHLDEEVERLSERVRENLDSMGIT